MAVLDYLRGAGLAVEANGERLRLSPPDRVTPDVLQFVRDHRAELVTDLLTERAAANDPQPAAEAPPAPAADHEPEAPGEPQHFTGTAATAAPAWQNARDQYLNHIMACRACHAPARHYCPTGRELHTTYNHTPMN